MIPWYFPYPNTLSLVKYHPCGKNKNSRTTKEQGTDYKHHVNMGDEQINRWLRQQATE